MKMNKEKEVTVNVDFSPKRRKYHFQMAKLGGRGLGRLHEN
jgi:hypothetical protein